MLLWMHITSGRGPLECSWVVWKLYEKISKEANKNGIILKIINSVPDLETNTFKSIMLNCDGEEKILLDFANSFEGSIQWIGRSLFRLNHKRKNLFVGVRLILPPKTDSFESKDFKIEKMKSSGPGGQHVNKVETAIRITHLPTGLTAIAQEERSQHFNKKLAYARINELLNREKDKIIEDKNKNIWSNHNNIERGNSIRVYVGRDFKRKKLNF